MGAKWGGEASLSLQRARAGQSPSPIQNSGPRRPRPPLIRSRTLDRMYRIGRPLSVVTGTGCDGCLCTFSRTESGPGDVSMHTTQAARRHLVTGEDRGRCRRRRRSMRQGLFCERLVRSELSSAGQAECELGLSLLLAFRPRLMVGWGLCRCISGNTSAGVDRSCCETGRVSGVAPDKPPLSLNSRFVKTRPYIHVLVRKQGSTAREGSIGAVVPV